MFIQYKKYKLLSLAPGRKKMKKAMLLNLEELIISKREMMKSVCSLLLKSRVV